MQSDKRKTRCLILNEIRKFFISQGFIETDTPTLVYSPGMEPHIRPMHISGGHTFLATSPEFAMKKLLSQGYEKIFQICKAYRMEPKSQTHHPEFTILEWYRSHSNYESIMDDIEALFVTLSQGLYGDQKFQTVTYGEQDLSRPWQRMTVEECFKKFLKLDLTKLFTPKSLAKVCVERHWANPDVLESKFLNAPGSWDELFFRVMLNGIEPALANLRRPVIVYLYPESQACLSNIMTDDRGFRWAKRFEVYAAGLELANAFDELTNPIEQRERFKEDMSLREAIYGKSFSSNPIDEELLTALSKMPPTGGIALGVDRLVMYFTGAKNIEEVLWLPSYI